MARGRRRVKAGSSHAFACAAVNVTEPIAEIHVADAIERLTARNRESLSDDREPKDPYRK